MGLLTHRRKRNSPVPNPLRLFDDARHTFESFLGGVHQWLYLGKWHITLAQVGLLVAACVFFYENGAELKRFQDACCYRNGEATAQELAVTGYCWNPRSTIARHTGGLKARSCAEWPTMSIIWLCVGLACLGLDLTIYFATYKDFRRKIDGHVKHYLSLHNLDTDIRVDADASGGLSILVLIRRTMGAFWIMTWVLGRHEKAVGRNTLYVGRLILLGICIVSGFILFGYVLPSEGAWGCYPTSDIDSEKYGMCTDPDSTAYDTWANSDAPPRNVSKLLLWSGGFFVFSFILLVLANVISWFGIRWRGAVIARPYEVVFMDKLHEYALTQRALQQAARDLVG